MRYTRYEYKKSNKIKFLCSVLIIVGVSIGGGVYISNLIFDGRNISNSSIGNSKNLSQVNDEEKVQNIVALQCGYYSKEENAKELLNSISKYCQPFIVEDDGKYRVLAGIYNEEDGLKKVEEFKSNNIDVVKLSFNIDNNSLEDKKILEIVDGFLVIINKLQDNSVKSIKTAEFKSWAENTIDGGSTTKLNKLSEYVKSLPDEINKSNSNTSMQELYKLIKF